jgi:hypothetical protein
LLTCRAAGQRYERPPLKENWSIVCANLTLLPEGLARLYKLRHTSERARLIGIRVVTPHTISQHHRDHPVQHVLTTFPMADFLCFQEVCTFRRGETLRRWARGGRRRLLAGVGGAEIVGACASGGGPACL